MRPLHLIDTTLRDGEQAAGVLLATADKVAIARALVDAGVPELEAGIPASGPEARADLRAIVRAVSSDRVLAWCRADARDLDAAAEAGVTRVHLSFPVSDLHLRVWRRDRAWLLCELPRLVDEAARRFDAVAIGAQDYSRADPGFMDELVFAIARTAARRLRLADTVGIACPRRIAADVVRLRQVAPELELEIHAHDDLGLATANTLAAWEAGAQAASVTVNGLGERAGNAALEQVVMAQSIAYGVATGIDTRRLAALSDLVASAAGRPVAPQSPIVGSAAFVHESGIHCAGVVRDPLTYEPFAPADVGRTRPEFVLGAGTGGAAVSAALARRAVSLSPEQARALAAAVRRASRDVGAPLTIDEVLALARAPEVRAPAEGRPTDGRSCA